MPEVVQLGPQTISLPELPPLGSLEIKLQFLALKAGVLKLPDVILREAGMSNALDTLAVSVLVT
jgi:hypothetical protein